MSKVKHQNIDHYVDPLAEDFIHEMHKALINLRNTADFMEATVDWSTLRIEEPDVVYAIEASGERTAAYSSGLLLQVDSVKIVEDSA